jgi:hypothetical protein
MKADYRNHLIEGTRAELLVAIGELQEGALHFGDTKLFEEARRGLVDLASGLSPTRVGVMTYDVTEDTPGSTVD